MIFRSKLKKICSLSLLPVQECVHIWWILM